MEHSHRARAITISSLRSAIRRRPAAPSRPLVRSATGNPVRRHPCRHPIANPLPDGGSLRSRPLFGSGSVSPHAHVGGETGRFALSGRSLRSRFAFYPPPVPRWGKRGELKGEKGIAVFRESCREPKTPARRGIECPSALRKSAFSRMRKCEDSGMPSALAQLASLSAFSSPSPASFSRSETT